MRIEICSHNFAVTDISLNARYVVEGFERRLTQYGFVKTNGRWSREPLKSFNSKTNDRVLYRFHINTYNAFLRYVEKNNIDPTKIITTIRPAYEPAKVDLPMRPQWQDLPHQPPYIEYLTKPGDPISRLIELQMGKGKGYITLKSCSLEGERILVVVRAMYLEKWQKEIHDIYDIEPEDLVTIQGSNGLRRIIEDGLNNTLTAKIILISNKTLLPWLKLYEEFQGESEVLGYGCTPDQFCEVLKVGKRIIDEVHQDFHFNFRLDTYTHVPKVISLSATLFNDDDFLNRMYELAYPKDWRAPKMELDKYAHSTAVIYKIMNPNKLRYKDYSRQTYSHNMLEQSIIKNKVLLQNYLAMILAAVRTYYDVDWQKGDRCIIFCASIEFATILTNYLKARYPHRDVRRYVENDPFENVLEGEITASTLLSSGTAVDIKGLTTVLLTTAIKSSQSNVQGFGRLRAIKGRRLNFVYFVCESITKHIEYHEHKRTSLKERSLSYRTEYYPKVL